MRSGERHAFTLVELSIVLVILGLLVGGVLSGQSLIRAAEIFSFNADHQRVVIAVNTFRGKYGGLPGDLANAESFWGTAAAGDTACADMVSTGTETCNGNGDGSVDVQAARSYEIWRFWQHLGNAGLIEGKYTGAPANGNWDTVPGTNAPRTKISRGTLAVVSLKSVNTWGGWYGNMFPPRREHWVVFGTSTGTNLYPFVPILKPSEAWNIDMKMDDGNPGRGNVTTMNDTQVPNCVTSDVAASANYQLQNDSLACVLLLGL